jgi:hypothetical protein
MFMNSCSLSVSKLLYFPKFQTVFESCDDYSKITCCSFIMGRNKLEKNHTVQDSVLIFSKTTNSNR